MGDARWTVGFEKAFELALSLVARRLGAMIRVEVDRFDGGSRGQTTGEH